MWFTVMHNAAPVGIVELRAGELASGIMLQLPAYGELRAVTSAATAALLELGLFGGPLPVVPPFPARLLRLRRALIRAARLELQLVDAQGDVAETSFVNLLEAPADHQVVVVASFGRAAAFVGATVPAMPRKLRGEAWQIRAPKSG